MRRKEHRHEPDPLSNGGPGLPAPNYAAHVLTPILQRLHRALEVEGFKTATHAVRALALLPTDPANAALVVASCLEELARLRRRLTIADTALREVGRLGPDDLPGQTTFWFDR